MRHVLKGIVFALLLTGVAQAQVYRCRDAAGTVVFTDSPDLYPGTCVESQAGPVPVVPMATPSGVDAAVDTTLRQETSDRQPAWLDRARQIFADYRQAEQQLYHTPQRSQAHLIEARAAMAQAGQAKTGLLKEMAAADASADQIQAVEELLRGVVAP